MSGANTAGGQLSEPFKNKVKSIKIINNLSTNIYYGLILHKKEGSTAAGLCSEPFLTDDLTKEEVCLPVPSAFGGSPGSASSSSDTGSQSESDPWKQQCLQWCEGTGAKDCQAWCTYNREGVVAAKKLTDDVCLVNLLPEQYRNQYITGVKDSNIEDVGASNYCIYKYGSNYMNGGDGFTACGRQNPTCQSQYPYSFLLTFATGTPREEIEARAVSDCQSWCNLYAGLPYEGSGPGAKNFSCCKCVFNQDQDNPSPQNGAPLSGEIFVWNAKTPETSGTGVDFYSEPWGKFLGARAGKYSVVNKDRQGNYWNYWEGNAQTLVFSNYANVNRPNSYKQLYKNFYQHPGSVALNGNYLFIVTNTANQVCQTFYKDVPNFNMTEFSATASMGGGSCGPLLTAGGSGGMEGMKATIIPLK